jgi:hypothetical protein
MANPPHSSVRVRLFPGSSSAAKVTPRKSDSDVRGIAPNRRMGEVCLKLGSHECGSAFIPPAFFDIADRVGNSLDPLGFVIGNSDLELFIQLHDQLDDVQ